MATYYKHNTGHIMSLPGMQSWGGVSTETAKTPDTGYSHDCKLKRWGHHKTCYGGIGPLSFNGGVTKNDDIFFPRTHQHFRDGTYGSISAPEPYRLTSLRLSNLRANDETVPVPNKTDEMFLTPERFPMTENITKLMNVSPYYTHIPIHQVFPTQDPNRVDSEGKYVLSKDTRGALDDLRNKYYCTTTYRQYTDEPYHMTCMKLLKGRERRFVRYIGCPVKCRDPFMQQLFYTIRETVKKNDVGVMLKFLMDMKNTHTCDHEKLLCTTNGRLHAQPYCLLWELIHITWEENLTEDEMIASMVELIEIATAAKKHYPNKGSWKKPVQWPPQSQYLHDYDTKILEGEYGKKEEPTKRVTIHELLVTNLNKSMLSNLQDDPEPREPQLPDNAVSTVEWPRRRCGVKEYSDKMNSTKPPTTMSFITPTGNRVVDRLKLPYKLAARRRHSLLYGDPVHTVMMPFNFGIKLLSDRMNEVPQHTDLGF